MCVRQHFCGCCSNYMTYMSFPRPSLLSELWEEINHFFTDHIQTLSLLLTKHCNSGCPHHRSLTTHKAFHSNFKFKTLGIPHGIPSMQEPSLILECRKNQPPNGRDPSEGPPSKLFQTFWLFSIARERPFKNRERGRRADAGGARQRHRAAETAFFVSNNCGTALAEKFSDAPASSTGLSLCCILHSLELVIQPSPPTLAKLPTGQ